MPFGEAREIVRSLGIKNHEEWCKYAKEKRIPKGITFNPNTTYKQEWISFINF